MADILRYVVLHHDGIADPHFDVMIEASPGGPLLTWRAVRWPLVSGDVLARLPDHRGAYLEYEGPVSRDRGVVTRVARGVVCVVSHDPRGLTIRFDDAPSAWTFTEADRRTIVTVQASRS